MKIKEQLSKQKVAKLIEMNCSYSRYFQIQACLPQKSNFRDKPQLNHNAKGFQEEKEQTYSIKGLTFR